MLVKCKLFGAPSIVEDERNIFIPTGKLCGIFYYILLKKVVNRDELLYMFWPTASEENARVSLRNALHKLRKIFKEPIIISPNKSTLILNQNITFEIDVEIFEKNICENIDVYTGELLKGLHTRNMPEFEYWVLGLQTYYKELFIATSKKILEKDFSEKNFEKLLIRINNILSVDNFNETAYLYLMKLYKEKGRNDKIVNEYYKFKKILNEELGIDPTEEFLSMYNQSLNEISKISSDAKRHRIRDFYDRSFELNEIQNNLNKFLTDEKASSMIIVGEHGIGKSTLKKEIINNNKSKIKFFETTCYNVEKNFSYSPFVKIIDSIDKEFNKNNISKPHLWKEVMKSPFFDKGDNSRPISLLLENKEQFNVDLIYHALLAALNILASKRKILFIVEDIHWADQLSIKMIINLILHKSDNVLFLLTKSEEESRSDRFLIALEELNKLLRIELKRFNRIEVGIIVRKFLKNSNISEDDIDQIYENSKGNTLFLKEYIELYKTGDSNKILSSKLYNLLKEKFAVLDETENNIVKIVSLFYGVVNVEQLLKIIGGKPFNIMQSLNNLVKMNIIEEQEENNKINICFVHSMYKDFISDGLKSSEKKIIHKEIARVIESDLTNNLKDITVYVMLKHHYSQAKDTVNQLKYEVYILNYYLNFSHELFPNLDDYDISKQVKLFIKNEKAVNWIGEIEKNILLVKNSIKTTLEIKHIERLFLYCKGRYFIRCGSYYDGVQVMQRVIKLSNEEGDTKMELLGYKQLMIYSIQINDPQEMLKYIIPAIKISRKLNSNTESAVLYRLYGVYYMMIGDFKAAENLFRKSIKLFLETIEIENNNSISLAADYNYIGEIRTAEQNYSQAMEYYEKAINLCQGTDASCLSIFYINAGKTSFFTGDLVNMKKYFLEAKEIVNKFDSYWKNSVLDAFLALCYFKEKDYAKTMEYLITAVAEVKTINNPRDIGSVYFIQSIIKFEEEKLSLYSKEIDSYLSETAELYYYKAIKYLDEKRDYAEIEFLKKNIAKK